MCICMLSIIVNNYSKIEREKNVFAFIPGLKSEVFPLTHINRLMGKKKPQVPSKYQALAVSCVMLT